MPLFAGESASHGLRPSHGTDVASPPDCKSAVKYGSRKQRLHRVSGTMMVPDILPLCKLLDQAHSWILNQQQ
jgi:hypothetical protein